MIKKASLGSILRLFGILDSSVCPYVAVQISTGGMPLFYRSSSFGFIQSRDFNPMEVQHFVSFSHLQDCLRASADDLEFLVSQSGIVCIESVDGLYHNLLHVHTVRESSTGIKHHAVGEPVQEKLDPDAFLGIDVSAFDLAQQPCLADGKLILGTMSGLVRWTVPDSIKHVFLYPRKSFLRLACGGKAEGLSLSEKGYWVVSKDGAVGCFASHTMGDAMHQVFNVPGTEVAKLDAIRLVHALKGISMLCGDNDKVYVGPVRGISCRDKFSNEATFSLGIETDGWAEFGMMGSTARLMADALEQSQEKEAVLYSIVPRAGGPAMRMARGLFEVDFRRVA